MLSHLYTIFVSVVVFGILVFIHESGHFLVCKMTGVGVDVFSLGFGPRLIGVKRGRTDYRISAVPLGGYVKMVGESPTDELIEEEKPVSFSHKGVWKRMAIVFAGPLANAVFTVVTFFVIFLAVGLPSLTSDIGTVQEGFPAAAAGVKEGDRVTAVNGVQVTKWDELSTAIRNSAGKPVALQVERDGKKVTLEITPKVSRTKNLFGEEVEVPMIGIGASNHQVVEDLDTGQAFSQGLSQTWSIIRLTGLSVVKLVERKVSVRESMGGPVMIAYITGQQAREGFTNLMFFMALISINLAILNLLPIPPLDGSHLFFFLVEFVRGKPVSVRKRELAQQIGMVLLISLMMLITYNDILRFF